MSFLFYLQIWWHIKPVPGQSLLLIYSGVQECHPAVMGDNPNLLTNLLEMGA